MGLVIEGDPQLCVYDVGSRGPWLGEVAERHVVVVGDGAREDACPASVPGRGRVAQAEGQGVAEGGDPDIPAERPGRIASGRDQQLGGGALAADPIRVSLHRRHLNPIVAGLVRKHPDPTESGYRSPERAAAWASGS